MGEAFDVTIITTEAIGDLIKQGKLTGASRTDVGRSELGIGIQAGAPKPGIRTPEALKKTLQDAKSITYPQDGASRGSIEKMFERMGIAAPSTRLRTGIEHPPVIVKILAHLGLPTRAQRAPRRSELIYSRQSESRKPLANASRRRRSL